MEEILSSRLFHKEKRRTESDLYREGIAAKRGKEESFARGRRAVLGGLEYGWNICLVGCN